MLVLSRRDGEGIRLYPEDGGPPIEFRVRKGRGGQGNRTIVEIDAPKSVRIVRKELEEPGPPSAA